VAELVGVANAGAFREEREEAALAQDRPGGLERVLVGLPAPDREGAQPHQQAPVARLDQLRLRHEAHVAARADAHEEGVPEALVVGGHDRRSLARDVLRARHVHAEIQAEEGRHDSAHERVQPARNTLLASEPIRLLISHNGGTYTRFQRSNVGYARHMSIFDKITGRAKKAAGDVTGDSSLRSQGRREERKGEEKDKLADAQERADEKAQDVADLERRT
jgi:uncharacterized protein YjbJ (UPF0337 family)